MNLKLIHSSLPQGDDIQKRLAAMKRTAEKARKDPQLSWELLMATGMYTKTGKIKKQFR